MTQTTISTIVSVVLLILAIFGANWLNLRFLERLLEQQTKAIKDLLEQQSKTMEAKLETIHTRIGAVEQRLDRLERQFDLAFKPTLSKTGD